MTDHDLPVDLIATPRAVIEVERAYDRARAGSSGTTCSRRRSARSRSSSAWGTRERQLAHDRRRPTRAPAEPEPRPDPADGPDPYGNPDPEWLRIDWREHLRTTSTSDGGATSTTSRSGRRGEPGAARARLRPRALAAAGRTGSRTSPTSPATTASSRSTCPGFGDCPMPDVGDLDPDLRRASCTTSATRSGVERLRAWSATRWAASSPPRRRSPQPERFEKLVLVSAAGVSSARLRREPAEVVARMLAAAAPLAFQLPDAGLPRARGCATPPSAGSSTTPTSCGRSCSGSTSHGGARRAGLPRRAHRPRRLRLPRPPRGDRGPDADRLGPQRPHRPARATRPSTRSGSRNARLEIFDRLRPRAACSSARCASTACSEAVPRLTSAQPVTAPSEAEETVFAYLAITPVAYAGSRRTRRRRPARRSPRRRARPRACAPLDVDRDLVAVAQRGDRAALDRLGGDVADHQPAGGAGEAAVGEQRDLLAEALADDRRGHLEHLAHPGAAGGALVADHDHVAGLDLLVLDARGSTPPRTRRPAPGRSGPCARCRRA